MNTKLLKYGIKIILVISILLFSGCPKPLQYHGMLLFPDIKRHVESQPFSFAAMAGSQGTRTQINKDVLPKLAYDCDMHQPDFLIFAGDMVNGSPDSRIAALALEEWQEIMTSNFQGPIVPIIGSQEIQSDASSDIYRQFFSNVPANGPADEIGLTYYFDYSNSRFIILDTSFRGDSERIRHFDWLESVLSNARNKNVDHIFVASHTPCWPVDGQLNNALPHGQKIIETGNRSSLEEAKKFWDILNKYKVAAYICGHEHVYTRQKIGGVWQVITGRAGAPAGRFNQPYPAQDATPDQKLRYDESLQYYKLLGYPHGPGQAPQAGSDFVGLLNNHYCIFTVTRNAIQVQMFGITDINNSRWAPAGSVQLLDKFEIKD